MDTGGPQVRASSVERLTKTVGTAVLGRIGMDEISHAPCRASNATDGSLTRSNGLPAAPELNVRPGRNPGAPQVAPPFPERTKPISVDPPLKKRPTWNALTTVLPNAKVSGSSSVACWLEELVNGSALTGVNATFAPATPEPTSSPTATATPHRDARRVHPMVVMPVKVERSARSDSRL